MTIRDIGDVYAWGAGAVPTPDKPKYISNAEMRAVEYRLAKLDTKLRMEKMERIKRADEERQRAETKYRLDKLATIQMVDDGARRAHEFVWGPGTYRKAKPKRLETRRSVVAGSRTAAPHTICINGVWNK